MIKGFPVTSSNVAIIGWKDNNTLYVQFSHGGSYSYYGVPRPLWQELIEAPSIGTFINRTIKPNYTATKLERSPFATPLAA